MGGLGTLPGGLDRHNPPTTLLPPVKEEGVGILGSQTHMNETFVHSVSKAVGGGACLEPYLHTYILTYLLTYILTYLLVASY